MDARSSAVSCWAPKSLATSAAAFQSQSQSPEAKEAEDLEFASQLPDDMLPSDDAEGGGSTSSSSGAFIEIQAKQPDIMGPYTYVCFCFFFLFRFDRL